MRLPIILAGLLAAVSAAPAAALSFGGVSYTFQGTCFDCVRDDNNVVVPGATQPVTGTLVLSSRPEDNLINSGNFVSWTYNGSAAFAAYTITSLNQTFVVGSFLQGTNRPNSFLVRRGDLYFDLAGDGVWSTGVLASADEGTGGFVAAADAGVPEPATWSLMVLGTGAVGAAARRRRRTGFLAA